MRPDRFRVRRIRRETSDTLTLDLEPADGQRSCAFRPGQFNMIYAFGAGEVPISVSGDPARGDVYTHTIRAVGMATRAMSRLKHRDMLGLRGPFGTAWPVEDAVGQDILVVAGGIGLAPLRPVMYYLLAHRSRYKRISLLYGARTPLDLLYRRELEKWRSRLDTDVHVTVDRSTGSWRGNVGVVTTLIGKAPVDPARSFAFVCGPEVMMRFSVRSLLSRGLPGRRIYLSMERNMTCGIGQCGHCQWGPHFVCRDGPVFRYDLVEPLFDVREI